MQAKSPECVVFGEPVWTLGSCDALRLLQQSLLSKCVSAGGFSLPVAVVSLVIHQTAFLILETELNYAAKHRWELLLRSMDLLISLCTEGTSSSC